MKPQQSSENTGHQITGGERLGERRKAGGNIWDKWWKTEAQKAPPDQTTVSDHPSSTTTHAHGVSTEEKTGLAGSAGDGGHRGPWGAPAHTGS